MLNHRKHSNRRSPRLGERRYDLDRYVAKLNTALIVEDDPAFADVLRQYLESYDYSVVLAKDGVQGIRRVMACDFDLIICDMLMPNLSGDMFYKAVERVKPRVCSRFIFMTGNHSDPKIREFIRSVRGIILWKPFQFHILHETIEAVRKNNRKHQPRDAITDRTPKLRPMDV